jgi:SAM-dependent methyltransferase
MLTADVVDYVLAALPPAPARVLEVGAGDGELAAFLRAGGYDVLAIDPEPSGAGVEPVALIDVAAPAAAFDAAVAVVSLHHLEPLGDSLARLGELVRPGGRLVVDEFDVAALDERAARWLIDNHASDHSPAELVAALRGHLHPAAALRAALEPWFELSDSTRGPYLNRWNMDGSLRAEEERLIAAGELPETGARFVGTRRA